MSTPPDAPEAPEVGVLVAGVVSDDRLGLGTLKLGTVDYGTQITNARLTPDVSTEDGTPTLGVPAPVPLTTIAWKLTGTAIQDFFTIAGFVNWLYDHALETVAFEFVPVTAKTTKWAGTCQVIPVEIGGDVATQITTDFELPVVGKPVRTP